MPKSRISRRPTDLNDAINRGSASSTSSEEPDENRLHTVNIRLPLRTWKQIDKLTSTMPGNVSRNTWIAQAVEDKLEREIEGQGS